MNTLRQFQIVAAAAEAATFSAAAAKLGITQPALSEAIRRLERELGVTLFERTTRSLRITDEGRRIAGIARDVMQDVERAMQRIAENALKGRVAIAALPSIACSALPAALAEFSRTYPDVVVSLHDVQHERAMTMLQDGEVDIAVTLKPAPSSDLSFEGVTFDTAHLVCRRDHPLARRRKVGWRDLAGHAFIGLTRISSVRRLTDAAFMHDDIVLTPRYDVEQVPSAVALVEAGLGVTALPSLTFAMFKGRSLVVRPLGDPVMRRHVGFVTRTSRTLPPFASALKQTIQVHLKKAVREA
ncbi:LysR family transcriptional regulator [Undibacter mobilis]|uniref:LysR family transcriptional regulator n=1 Tax=Undibacter mobilis TaxID=2292256 RepID=A0A371BAJ9_9BRAD|nr:LysR family transcriptional regulator [Undibacter mobilis]RDV04626.1 LysR family transcriptional regulator [Undibacter mobilis]